MSTNTPIRVVLADDHAVVRTGIRQFLEMAGDIQVVAEAEDGRRAVLALQQHRPDVAVLGDPGEPVLRMRDSARGRCGDSSRDAGTTGRCCGTRR